MASPKLGLNPNAVALYREQTKGLTGQFNVTETRTCQGCKTLRSKTQYKTETSKYCNQCVSLIRQSKKGK
jgi:hypothetical protein